MIGVARVTYDSGTLFGRDARLTVEVEYLDGGQHVVPVEMLPEQYVEALRDWLKP